MDCGPAALTCLLAGFGVHVQYARIREACSTSVDGTSIDSVEEIACMFGLDAEQILAPAEHIVEDLANNLPALAILRQGHGNHLVVLWRHVGNWIQIMDPAQGGRWMRIDELVGELYQHKHVLPQADWREWMGEEEQRRILGARLLRLGAKETASAQNWADEDPGWSRHGALDAAVRMTQSLIDAGIMRRGAQAATCAQELAAQACATTDHASAIISPRFWSVVPAEEGDCLVMRGAVLMTAKASASEGQPAALPVPELPSELRAAREQPLENPALELWKILRDEGLRRPLMILGGILVAAFAVTLEALLFRTLLDVQVELALPWQRAGALAAVVALLCAALLLEVSNMRGLMGLGRLLESRFRMMLLRKLPRLGVDYFHSRLVSDMAERSHAVDVLRTLPALAGQVVEATAKMLMIVLAIAWLYPQVAMEALLLCMAVLVLPCLFHPFLVGREMRMRIHNASLSRGYLDALLGMSAIRAHDAERTLRREHDSRILPWSNASRRLNRLEVLDEGAQTLVGLAGAALIITVSLAQLQGDPTVLLLAYWVLQLPAQGQAIAMRAREYPAHRNTIMRILEPCHAPEVEAPEHLPASRAAGAVAAVAEAGVAIEMRNMTVVLGGHVVLDDLNLRISPGEHVAVVGRSGSGKSTLVGMLLGWHSAPGETLWVDGVCLGKQDISRLRDRTAWIDPAAQIWNRPLLDNLVYGAAEDDALDIAAVLETAQLHAVLQDLEDGLQTQMGESGGRLSGGEAQRLRIGRALLRRDARLVVLDEPFRGLEREQRQAFLLRVRAWWPEATLLFVSHDISDAMGFDRVLVMDQGQIVEEGVPRDLATDVDSRFGLLFRGEREVNSGVWGATTWKRLRLEKGRLEPAPQTP